MKRIAIIGGGITGTAIAMYMSLYDCDVILIEKGDDIASHGATKANTAILHAGYDPDPGTMMARMNVRGNQLYRTLAEDLGLHIKITGTIVVARSEEEMKEIERLHRQGKANGVDTRVISGPEALELERNLNDPAGALYAPTGGIVHPMGAAISFATAAKLNGTKIMLSSEVRGINNDNGTWRIETTSGTVEADVVVNAAGLYADTIAEFAGVGGLKIHPRKGEWAILSNRHPPLVKMPVFPAPTPMGKGITVTPTIDGDYLIGPTAEDIDDKTDVENTQEGIRKAFEGASKLIRGIRKEYIVRTFAGLRAIGGDDFIIGRTEMDCFYNAAGIKSPGLVSAPAIGEYLSGMIADDHSIHRVEERTLRAPKFIPFRYLPESEKAALIRKRPEYGNVICRCSQVTEGDIIDAIHYPIGARTVDGIKRRTKATGGECQGSRCTNAIARIIARELSIPVEEVVKDNGGRIYIGRLRP